MRRIRPESRLLGVTLIEVVITVLTVGIIAGAVTYFLYPLREKGDTVARAELTDIADNALQRIGRDVRLALPNSVRVDSTSVPGKVFLEFLVVRTAGRYRGDTGSVAGGTNCPDDGSGVPTSDQLSFDTADSCFKTIGKSDANLIVAGSDQLVLNNYGPGFTGQDAYATTGTLNRAGITAVDTSEAGRDRIAFSSTTFQRALHDSPGRRFYAISGPASYVCDTGAGTISRYDGYAIAATQRTDFTGLTPALLAQFVTTCQFDYTPNVSPQIGMLTMRVKLAKTLSGGETASSSLYHAVHVSNVP
jgi:MSHA biogenesis protein MshO